MKIAIDGAQSTGKTTLFNKLKNSIKFKRFLPETARCMAPHFNIHNLNDWEEIFLQPEKYSRLLEKLILHQLSEETPNSIIDCSIYSIIAYARTANISGFDKYLPLVEYDLIIYCPIFFDIVNDGFRYMHMREEIDYELRKLIKRYHDREIIYVSGTTEDRYQMVKEKIQ